MAARRCPARLPEHRAPLCQANQDGHEPSANSLPTRLRSPVPQAIPVVGDQYPLFDRLAGGPPHLPTCTWSKGDRCVLLQTVWPSGLLAILCVHGLPSDAESVTDLLPGPARFSGGGDMTRLDPFGQPTQRQRCPKAHFGIVSYDAIAIFLDVHKCQYRLTAPSVSIQTDDRGTVLRVTQIAVPHSVWNNTPGRVDNSYGDTLVGIPSRLFRRVVGRGPCRVRFRASAGYPAANGRLFA